MAAKSTLTADSVGQREFVIRYTLTAFPMTLYRCWNLVAMPVVPSRDSVGVIVSASTAAKFAVGRRGFSPGGTRSAIRGNGASS